LAVYERGLWIGGLPLPRPRSPGQQDRRRLPRLCSRPREATGVSTGAHRRLVDEHHASRANVSGRRRV